VSNAELLSDISDTTAPIIGWAIFAEAAAAAGADKSV
jgi:hypothetical protein